MPLQLVKLLPNGGFQKNGRVHIGFHFMLTMVCVATQLSVASSALSLDPVIRAHLLRVTTHPCLQEPFQEGQIIEHTEIEHPCKTFSSFYDSTTFSDIVIKAADVEVHAHKVVLASHSSSIAAMLQVRVVSVCPTTFAGHSNVPCKFWTLCTCFC